MAVDPIARGLAARAKSDAASSLVKPINARPPKTTDDTSRGFSVGSPWRASGRAWTASRVTAGAAVWQELLTDPRAAYPVDAVGGTAPSAAYGTALLVAAYAGNCLDVVRASDSSSKTIGFKNGVIDYQTLDAFLAGTTGVVSKWYDQSGNANDAVQATAANRPQIYGPTHDINGIRPISFDGTVWLTMPAGVSLNQNAFTVLSLARMGAYCSYSASLGTALVSLGAPTEYWTMSLQVPSGWNILDSSTNYAASQRSFQSPSFIGALSNGATAYNIYQNEETSAQGRTLASQAITGGTIHNCGRAANYNGYMDLVAMVVYPRALSAADITTAKRAIYRLGDITPQVDAQVVYVGDSITAGFGPVEGMERARIEQLSFSRPALVWSQGLSGQTIANIATLGGSWAASSMAKSAYRKNIMVLFAGSNDINGGATAATTYANLTTYITAAHAAGFKVVVSTMLPRSTLDAGKQVIWAAYNALIRANTAGADAIADLQADPTMGPVGATADSSLYGDGIHPTTYGYAILASIEIAAVNQLLGYPE